MKTRYCRWALTLLISGQALVGLPAFSEPSTKALQPANEVLVHNALRGLEGGSCRDGVPFAIDQIVAIKKCMPLTENCASAASCDNLPPGSYCGQYPNGTDKHCKADGACCSCS